MRLAVLFYERFDGFGTYWCIAAKERHGMLREVIGIWIYFDMKLTETFHPEKFL